MRADRQAPESHRPAPPTEPSGRPDKVVKKLAPGQPGTVRLLEQYGDALVCVRHRHDAHDLHRWTTVELIVDHGPVRGARDPQLWVRIGRLERSLQDAVRAAGGRWSPREQLWQIRRSVVHSLGLNSRVTAAGRGSKT